MLPHFRDLNDCTLPDHLHDEVHEDYDISECTMVKSYRFARYLQHFDKLHAECKRQTAHLVNNYAKNKKKIGRRKYSSNQHKKSKSTEELLLNSVESASRRKIKIPDLLKEQDSQNVNIIVELDLLSSLMKNPLCCKYCCSSEKIELREDLKSRRGLAVSLEIICHNCGESTSTMSSKISNKCYDVNLILTNGMRAIGKGGAAARIFCGLMNLPPPPAKFERHNSLFLNVLKTISEDSMNAAVYEAVIANDNNSNIAVAVDGTWHKRGYSSLNGVVCATSVENGKVIDFEALTKYCSSCKGHERAIWAIYFHKLSTEDNPQHALCPLGEDSWCGYNRSIVTGEFYIHKHSLPESILLKVKKVFRDLTEKDLLKKCLHGRTQNPNESFNKCIWERIPKTVFVGIKTLKFGVMDAVICFNDGYVSRIKVFEALGIKPGYNTERALLIIDNKRIFEAERIVNKVSLEARNKGRSLKRKMDKQNLDEENEYQAGKY
ncbi:uncharacterized protein TNCV_1559981 [Trichonephila clavipes]|nr:uncharacterized protein TNCV_1559981 [Trichonephila clavipes]